MYNAPDKHGRGYGQGIVYEEFFYHRLVLENETVVRPHQLVDLLPFVKILRRYDDASRRIGEAARARATRELSVEAAMCYWAVLLAEVGALQRIGGSLLIDTPPSGHPFFARRVLSPLFFVTCRKNPVPYAR